MAIEYIPISTLAPDGSGAAGRFHLRASLSHLKMRLEVISDGKTVADVLIDPNDIYRAWMALRPSEEW